MNELMILFFVAQIIWKSMFIKGGKNKHMNMNHLHISKTIERYLHKYIYQNWFKLEN